MKNNTKIYIGTSGWTYDDWEKSFYPFDIKRSEWLKYYSKHFNTVEINVSFYHQIKDGVYEKWRKIVPQNFIFSVKISRYLTHIKKLNEPKEPWERFINNVKFLGRKLGPILVQLPPNFKVNIEKISNLLKIIPSKYKIALEVRNNTWFTSEVYNILKKHNASLVLADSEECPSLTKAKFLNKEITANFIYIRMHGPGNLYSSKYTITQLKRLAKNIELLRRKTKEIYVYFNNDTNAYAIENAIQLKKIISINFL